jgi:hypothetical protein
MKVILVFKDSLAAGKAYGLEDDMPAVCETMLINEVQHFDFIGNIEIVYLNKFEQEKPDIYYGVKSVCIENE